MSYLLAYGKSKALPRTGTRLHIIGASRSAARIHQGVEQSRTCMPLPDYDLTILPRLHQRSGTRRGKDLQQSKQAQQMPLRSREGMRTFTVMG